MRENLSEEPGLTEEQFRAGEKRRQEEIKRHIAESRNGPKKLYFIFETEEQRNRALRLISEKQEYNDLFRFLINWQIDPLRHDTGLEMDFSRHFKNPKEELEEFFRQNQLTLKEEYEVTEE